MFIDCPEFPSKAKSDNPQAYIRRNIMLTVSQKYLSFTHSITRLKGVLAGTSTHIECCIHFKFRLRVIHLQRSNVLFLIWNNFGDTSLHDYLLFICRLPHLLKSANVVVMDIWVSNCPRRSGCNPSTRVLRELLLFYREMGVCIR